MLDTMSALSHDIKNWVVSKFACFEYFVLYGITLIKGTSCNDKQQISQLIKLGIVGQQQQECNNRNQHTLQNKYTHQ